MDQLADGCWHGAIWAKNSDSMEQGSSGHCVQQTNILLTHHLGHMQLWPQHVETSWSSSVKQSFVGNFSCFLPITYQYGTSQWNTLHSLISQQLPVDTCQKIPPAVDRLPPTHQCLQLVFPKPRQSLVTGFCSWVFGSTISIAGKTMKTLSH